MTTYEDALKYLKDKNSYTEHLSSYVGVHWGEVYDIAIEAIEKQIKYRWHDLRKNPEDLPTNDDYVLIAYTWRESEKVYYYFESFVEGEFLTPSEAKVIAWKYIEPLEEEKE